MDRNINYRKLTSNDVEKLITSLVFSVPKIQ